MNTQPTVYVISDSLGETGEKLAHAAISQFDQENIDVIRVPFVRNSDQVREVVLEAAEKGAIICHTLVSPDLRETLDSLASEHQVRHGPAGPHVGRRLVHCKTRPRMKPGLIHKLDEEYFKKVEAIEFAVKYDDGKNPPASRRRISSSWACPAPPKTPMSMYLAHKKYKVANLPLVPEVALPEEIFRVPPYRIVGLIIDPYS